MCVFTVELACFPSRFHIAQPALRRYCLLPFLLPANHQGVGRRDGRMPAHSEWARRPRLVAAVSKGRVAFRVGFARRHHSRVECRLVRDCAPVPRASEQGDGRRLSSVRDANRIRQLGQYRYALSIIFLPLFCVSTFSSFFTYFVFSSHHSVRIWDYATGKCLVTGIGHTDAITGLSYTPSATQLASCSIDVRLSIHAHAGQCS